MRRFAPMMVGLALLGWFGSGMGEVLFGPREQELTVGSSRVPVRVAADVMAHVTGFASGVGLGFLTGRARLPDRLSRRAQGWLAAAALATVAGAWALALVTVD